jgi:hypothetical protein
LSHWAEATKPKLLSLPLRPAVQAAWHRVDGVRDTGTYRANWRGVTGWVLYLNSRTAMGTTTFTDRYTAAMADCDGRCPIEAGVLGRRPKRGGPLRVAGVGEGFISHEGRGTFQHGMDADEIVGMGELLGLRSQWRLPTVRDASLVALTRRASPTEHA